MPIIRTPTISSGTRQLRRARAVKAEALAPAVAPKAAALPSVQPPVPVQAVQPAAPPAPVAGAFSTIDQEAVRAAVARATDDALAKVAEREQATRLRMDKELNDAMAVAEQRGYAAGLERGEALARKAVHEQLERIGALGLALSQNRAKVLEQAQDDSVEIVFTALCRIIGTAATEREAVAGMVAQTLASFKHKTEHLVVRLHPQDHALLMKAASVLEVTTLDAGLDLRADASVRVGGCLVDGNGGTLDARLDTQLGSVRDALLKVRRAYAHSQEQT
ncbi:MAG TPA: FliH/SctL family protein [Telluria sp.]|jgi:flagellar assembly protein FliH